MKPHSAASHMSTCSGSASRVSRRAAAGPARRRSVAVGRHQQVDRVLPGRAEGRPVPVAGQGAAVVGEQDVVVAKVAVHEVLGRQRRHIDAASAVASSRWGHASGTSAQPVTRRGTSSTRGFRASSSGVAVVASTIASARSRARSRSAWFQGRAGCRAATASKPSTTHASSSSCSQRSRGAGDAVTEDGELAGLLGVRRGDLGLCDAAGSLHEAAVAAGRCEHGREARAERASWESAPTTGPPRCRSTSERTSGGRNRQLSRTAVCPCGTGETASVPTGVVAGEVTRRLKQNRRKPGVRRRRAAATLDPCPP